MIDLFIQFQLHFIAYALVTGDIVKISFALSSANIQSRFISNFDTPNLLIDTPIQTIQGFVVDKMCVRTSAFIRQDHGILMKQMRNSNLWLFIDNDVSSTFDDSIVSIHLGGICSAFE